MCVSALQVFDLGRRLCKLAWGTVSKAHHQQLLPATDMMQQSQ